MAGGVQRQGSGDTSPSVQPFTPTDQEAQRPWKGSSSAIFIEMASSILANPAAPPSHEAAVALYLTNVAWMRVLGVESLAAGDETFLSRVGQENRSLWRELKSRDVEALIRDLTAYKRAHHPEDRRHVTFCGISDQKVRVEWTDPPGA